MQLYLNFFWHCTASYRSSTNLIYSFNICIIGFWDRQIFIFTLAKKSLVIKSWLATLLCGLYLKTLCIAFLFQLSVVGGQSPMTICGSILFCIKILVKYVPKSEALVSNMFEIFPIFPLTDFKFEICWSPAFKQTWRI